MLLYGMHATYNDGTAIYHLQTISWEKTDPVHTVRRRERRVKPVTLNFKARRNAWRLILGLALCRPFHGLYMLYGMNACGCE